MGGKKKYSSKLSLAQKRILKVLSNPKLTKQQKKKLKELSQLGSVNNLADNTVAIKLECLQKFALWFKRPFEKATKKDIIEYFSQNKKEYPLHRIQIKFFYSKFLKMGDVVDWIKTTGNSRNKLPEELITKQEIKTMVENSISKRNKAIIMLLYDSAVRVGELVNLKVKNLNFDNLGARLVVPKGKTGMRKLRIHASVPYLKEYLSDEHPKADNPDSPLFVGVASKGSKKISYGRKLDEQSIRILLKRTVVRAGIKKNIYPHLFRHTRLTELAKFLNEQALRQFAGWTPNSNMASVYVHFSDEDVGRQILESEGVIQEKDKVKENELKPFACIDPTCQHINPATAKFCAKCHRPLDIKTIMDIEKKTQIADEVYKRSFEKSYNVSRDLLKSVIKEMIVEGKILL